MTAYLKQKNNSMKITIAQSMKMSTVIKTQCTSHVNTLVDSINNRTKIIAVLIFVLGLTRLRSLTYRRATSCSHSVGICSIFIPATNDIIFILLPNLIITRLQGVKRPKFRIVDQCQVAKARIDSLLSIFPDM